MALRYGSLHVRSAAVLLFALLASLGVRASPPVQATLALGSNTQGIAIDPVLAKAFVTNYDSGTVSVIDINAQAVVATVNAGLHPKRIIADAATHRVYITNDNAPGTLTVLDGTTNAVVATIPVGNLPRGLGSNFLIGEVYVSNVGSNSVSVISTASNTVVATLPVGSSPGGPSSNDLLRKVYVPSNPDNTVTVIDARTRTVIKTIPVGKGPIAATIDAQHGKVYVNNEADKTVSVLDSATDALTATLPSGAGGGSNGNSNFITVSGVYHRAYLPNANDNTLTIINTDSDTVVRTVPVGVTPMEAIVDANGGNVYVVNQGSGSVSILSAATETVVDTLSVGNGPWRIVDGLNHLFVLNANGSDSDSLTVAAEEDTLSDTAIATEFYEAAFNHYFNTADEVETRLIVDGLFNDDWHRTFLFVRVWTAPGTGRVPVCRFFSTAFGARSSHFYTPYAAECQHLQTDPALASTWQLESTAVYYLALTDGSGGCPNGTSPLYRVYNNGQGGAPNHRYTGDRSVRDQMVASGWVAEGNGPDTIFACTPSLRNG